MEPGPGTSPTGRLPDSRNIAPSKAWETFISIEGRIRLTRYARSSGAAGVSSPGHAFQKGFSRNLGKSLSLLGCVEVVRGRGAGFSLVAWRGKSRVDRRVAATDCFGPCDTL